MLLQYAAHEATSDTPVKQNQRIIIERCPITQTLILTIPKQKQNRNAIGAQRAKVLHPVGVTCSPVFVFSSLSDACEALTRMHVQSDWRFASKLHTMHAALQLHCYDAARKSEVNLR